MIKRSFHSTVKLFVAAALLVSGCTKLTSFNHGLTSGNPAYLTDSAFYTHVIKNVSLATLAATGGATPLMELSVTVDTGRAGFTPLTSYCGSGGTNPCKCDLTWTEVNTIGGTSTSFSRNKRLDTTQVQSGLVKCQMSQEFWNEIATGTTIRVNIVPVSTNVTGLNAQSIGYKKGTSTTANGDFLDDTLTPFRNIHRYTCFSKRQASYEILNQFAQSTDANSNVTNVLLASRFCTGTTSSACATPRNGYSAQSYYRNLYIRSDKLGEINSTNTYYDCPKVVESIRYSANSNIPSSEKGKYWPLDTTFALATQYSAEWSVGVRSGTVLHKDGDSSSVSDACMNEDTAKRLAERGIIIKCLGYAKTPNPNGTCGQLTDSNGRVRPMVRLRRYRAIYPGTFKPSGDVDTGAVEADEIYVADRLVIGPTGVPTGGMIYGPKPCNTAWFDHEGVVNRDSTVDFGSNMQDSGAMAGSYARPAYVSTSNYYRNEGGGVSWSVNPDGQMFPRFDRDGSFTNLERPFCSATLPHVEEVMGTPAQVRLLSSFQRRVDHIALGTRNVYLKEVHLKPIDPWTPNYVEDLSFQACVPIADPYLEPPLHFYKKDANTIAWCAKAYPTQNPYWLDLNARKKPVVSTFAGIAVAYPAVGGTYPSTGMYAPVKNYTSHQTTGLGLDTNNSCAGTKNTDVCLMSIGSTTGEYANCSHYLDTAVARTTCDRTVTFDSNQAYRGFPLQAEDADITTMLSQDLDHDRSFSCQYSVNPDPSKVGTRVPLTGCCGLVNGTPVLDSLINGATTSGHLEPFVNSSVPDIRYCGNPVDIP